MNENCESQRSDNQTPQSALPTDPSVETEESVTGHYAAKNAKQWFVSRLYWFIDFWKRDWQRFTDDLRKLSSGERLAFYVTFIGLLGAALTIRVLTYTLQEMQSGSEDTHQLAITARTQAQKMQSMSTAADKIREAAEKMVTQDQRIADNAKNALDASNRQSQASLDASIGSSRLDQRAWVGVLDLVPRDFSETSGMPVVVVFFNSGKTPARNVQISSMFRIVAVPMYGPSPENIKHLIFRPAQSIAPQGRYNQILGERIPSGDISTPPEIQGLQTIISEFQDIKAKRHILYYFGILKYDDVFGHSRETEFCIYLADPDSKQFAFCRDFNDLN